MDRRDDPRIVNDSVVPLRDWLERNDCRLHAYNPTGSHLFDDYYFTWGDQVVVLTGLLDLGMNCTKLLPAQRPAIAEVITALERLAQQVINPMVALQRCYLMSDCIVFAAMLCAGS